MGIEVREPPKGFAVAEVIGVDPAGGAVQSPILQAALAKFGVVCLRMDQPLEDEELRSVARLFGAIKDPVGRTVDGGEIRYDQERQIIDTGFVLTDELREQLGDPTFGGLDDRRPGLFETFHCDDTYTEKPARATVLHARELPPSGGGPTCFIDMRDAYERLKTATKREVDGLRVLYAYNNDDAFPPRRSARGPSEVLVEVDHPLIRTHAVAGTRALFCDLDRAKHVEGMPIDEGVHCYSGCKTMPRRTRRAVSTSGAITMSSYGTTPPCSTRPREISN